MEEINKMPFGKQIRVGNFYFVKTTRSLGKKELATLRNQSGIPQDVRKHLGRGGLPYITVGTIGGGWHVSYVAGSVMYAFIESEYGRMDGAEGRSSLRNLFTMLYADTTVMGDAEYWRAKGEALKSLMERQKSADDATAERQALDDLERYEHAKSVIAGMAGEITKEERAGV